MPGPEFILDGLRRISNDFVNLSILFHILIVAFFTVPLFRRNATNKVLSVLLLILPFSVSLLAFLNSNPFNGAVFLVITVILLVFGLKSNSEKIETNSPIHFAAAVIFLLFGLFYPHFLNDANWFEYAYKAPIGLIPCPTLLVLGGITLLYRGFQNSKWVLALSAAGLFYGIFGVLRLDVKIDVVLIISSIWLMFYGIKPKIKK